MNTNPETQPMPSGTPATPDDLEARSGLRGRVLGLRAVAAVALASLVLGGLGGTALGALAVGGETDQQEPGTSQLVPGQDGQVGQEGQLGGGRGQFQGGQGPGGEVPPGTAPDADVAPDTGTGEVPGGTTT